MKFDQMRDNNPAKQGAESDSTGSAYDETYPEEGHVRNLCFVQQNGKRCFLNYSYLVSGEYDPDENTITLIYTTHKIFMKGVNLESVYYKIMEQQIRQIVCMHTRYNVVGKDSEPVVNEIQTQNII